MTTSQTVRAPQDAEERAYWLANMAAHGYTLEEMSEATGLSLSVIQAELDRPGNANRSSVNSSECIRILPYPGGRHPRIGFQDGAIDPQRETKVSVFTPWDTAAYVVVDVPEAVFSNLGLLYLAHTHVPTLWTEQGIELPVLEWDRSVENRLSLERRLPNDVVISARVEAGEDAVQMDLSLLNGTDQLLSGLRVQNCVMLKAAAGFEAQTNANKRFIKPFAVTGCGDNHIITAWERCGRVWGNELCPCMHSDPVFEDCPPGATVSLRGWLWFYTGNRLDDEIAHLSELCKLPLAPDEGQP